MTDPTVTRRDLLKTGGAIAALSFLPLGLPAVARQATPTAPLIERRGWLLCNGAELPADRFPELAELFSALPNLRGYCVAATPDAQTSATLTVEHWIKADPDNSQGDPPVQIVAGTIILFEAPGP